MELTLTVLFSKAVDPERIVQLIERATGGDVIDFDWEDV